MMSHYSGAMAAGARGVGAVLAPLGGLSKAQGSAAQAAALALAIGGATSGAASAMEPPFTHPLSCLLQEACRGAHRVCAGHMWFGLPCVATSSHAFSMRHTLACVTTTPSPLAISSTPCRTLPPIVPLRGSSRLSATWRDMA